MISSRYEHDLMATKRNDPDYEQVSGYVHKDVALQFRILCATERITQSDLLEEALRLLVESKSKTGPVHETEPPAPKPTAAAKAPTVKAKPATAKAKRSKDSKGAN